MRLRGRTYHPQVDPPQPATIKDYNPTTKALDSPVPQSIPHSYKKRAVSKKMAESGGFRILDLPDELRLKIYGFILPYKERIFLDPQNHVHPLPYRHESYGSTFGLLLANKKIHYEATEFIYANNTVNIVRPSKAGDFLNKLGTVACQYITKLECHITRDLGDIGKIWRTMDLCPKLEELRLIFYHDRNNWHRVAAQIAYQIKTEENINLDLELYDSIWALPHYGQEKIFSLAKAEAHAEVYSFTLPAPVKKIVVTSSISRGLPDSMLQNEGRDEWQLRHIGTQQNGAITTLRWIGRDIVEQVDTSSDDDE